MTGRPPTELEVRIWLREFPDSYVVAPLCEDWLRKAEALEMARSGWAHYRDGQTAKGTRLLDAALVSHEPADTEEER